MQVLFEDVNNEKLQKRLERLMEYCVAYFNYNPDFISIDFRVEEDFGYDAEAGLADHADPDWPEEFEITIDPELLKDEEKLMKTVAHEMVHVMQYAMGELRVEGKKFYWKGERYKTGDPITRAEYYSFPWEVQAYGLENALYYGFEEQELTVNKLLEIMAS